MAKLTKAFYGVPDGAIYPIEYKKGDDCPDELMVAAIELGAIAAKDKAAWEKSEAERGLSVDESEQEPKDDE